jgi:hypothetical protein
MSCFSVSWLKLFSRVTILGSLSQLFFRFVAFLCRPQLFSVPYLPLSPFVSGSQLFSVPQLFVSPLVSRPHMFICSVAFLVAVRLWTSAVSLFLIAVRLSPSAFSLFLIAVRLSPSAVLCYMDNFSEAHSHCSSLTHLLFSPFSHCSCLFLCSVAYILHCSTVTTSVPRSLFLPPSALTTVLCKGSHYSRGTSSTQATGSKD